MSETIVHLSGNQYPIRTVINVGGEDALHRARQEREKVMAKWRRARRRAAQAAYDRVYRANNSARIAERKRRWRAANRERINAYMRRYEHLTPGRREYKTRKAREYRARDRAAA